MKVRILGSAAGGGVPQWNCGCGNCARARRGELPQRTQSSIAVGDGDDWMLVNAAVDLPRQLAAMPQLWPNALRATPFRAVLLTDGNVDHTAGLGELRQGPDAFAVVSSAATKSLLASERAYERFDRDPHHWIAAEPDGSNVASQIHPSIARRFEVAAYDVPGLLPGYAGRTTWRGAVVAYRIRDRASGANVVVAPVYSAIDQTLERLIENADLALLDGTFFSEDELQSLGLPAKPASAMGHLAVGGAGGTLERVAAVGRNCVLVHVNNTNPILDPASQAFAAVARAGVRVAMDGDVFDPCHPERSAIGAQSKDRL
ncbi:MAG TPA: MBL fold metallo-hydrolase [Candidatus Acidoferrales bacterium]|jgi:pyrroloquinoline quinone biosynthesis protein B|nr:MBL fold metallo-hydrolase [Candidatus Acidoferrales bacterium]